MHDLLKPCDSHLLLHDYDFPENSFLTNVNNLANHLDELLSLSTEAHQEVVKNIIERLKEETSEFFSSVFTIKTGNLVITNNIQTGSTITLPKSDDTQVAQMRYIVGSNNLNVFYNGTVLIKDKQYQEVGISGEISDKIKLLQDIDVNTKALCDSIDMLSFKTYTLTLTNELYKQLFSSLHNYIVSSKSYSNSNINTLVPSNTGVGSVTFIKFTENV